MRMLGGMPSSPLCYVALIVMLVLEMEQMEEKGLRALQSGRSSVVVWIRGRLVGMPHVWRT